MATITSIASGKWNADASSVWDTGVAPTYDDIVIIDAGHIIELDGICQCGDGTYFNDNSPWSPSSNFRLWLKGTLKASRTVDSSLDVRGMIGADVATGWESTLDFGTEADPIPANINFTWHMNTSGFKSYAYYHGVGLRGISSTRMPKLYMRSAVHRIRNTYLIKSYVAGVTSIEVNDSTGWEVGDKLVLAPQWTTISSSPHTNYNYDEVTITSVSGNIIGISATTYAHGYDDVDDIEAGAVSNLTSNVILTGDGDDRIFPAIYIYRGVVDIKDVEVKYANNGHSFYSSPLKFGLSNYYDNQEMKLESCSISTDMQNLSRNAQAVMYHYSPMDKHGKRTVVKDVFHYAKVKSGYSMYNSYMMYYGGQNSLLENCNSYGANKYINQGYSCYQQPTTMMNCKSFNSSTAYYLHNNVDIDTSSSWAVGSQYAFSMYNGTAIHNDMKIRWSKKIAEFVGGWRGKAVANRLNFKDEHLYYDNPKDYVNTPDGLPDGNLYTLVDIQNNTDNQDWYYSYGRKWWELTEKRNDPHSIGMKSTSDTYVIPHERTFSAVTGDSMLVGLYVKNLTANFIGTLTVSILQGSEVIQTEDFDLTTLTDNEWNLLSISGVATKTMTTTFKMEYKGEGGEIALTDFSQPFTADQKAQAKAVWGELLTENKATGSFGETIGTLKTWVGWLRKLL